MPELPEVEITRRGIAPALHRAVIDGVRLSDKPLRWPAPADFNTRIAGQRVLNVDRRGKYLLIECERGWLILHLGMSGSLRVHAERPAPGRWDHFDLLFSHDGTERLLRLTDPRRFGAALWHPREQGPIAAHPLLSSLGVEPLSPTFTGALLRDGLRQRSVSIKQALLAGDIVVGVGNIYASEALFRAGIRPTTPAGRVALERCERLADAVRETLGEAIDRGGSTLRNFVGSDGSAGHFQNVTFVYGRAGEPCRRCGTAIRVIRQGGRSTYYCSRCQR